MLVSHEIAAQPVVTTARPSAPASAAVPQRTDELSELFNPVVSSSPDDHLPSAGITQTDLDRLFRGAV